MVRQPVNKELAYIYEVRIVNQRVLSIYEPGRKLDKMHIQPRRLMLSTDQREKIQGYLGS